MPLIQLRSTQISPGHQAWLHSCLTDQQEAYCQDLVDHLYYVIMMTATLLHQ